MKNIRRTEKNHEPNASGNLPEIVALRLAADLDRYRPDGRLPPLRNLCAAYDISRQTLALAVHRLAEKGLVTLRPQQPARINPGPGAVPIVEPATPAITRLLRHLRSKLVSGEWQTPMPLPKISSLAQEWHVSNRSVMKVYRHLLKDGLVHSQGRLLLAGPAPARGPSATLSTHPALIIVGRSLSAWKALADNSRSGPFARAFVREAEAFGIRLLPVLMNTAKRSADGVPAGLTDVSDFIRGLGPLYRGALVIGNRKEVPYVDTWLRTLEKFKAPVAWFDANDEGFSHKRPRETYRCHLSEKAMVRAALDFLAVRGHRRIAYIHMSDKDPAHPSARKSQEPWESERLRLVLGLAPKTVPSLSIIAHQVYDSEDWLSPTSTGIYSDLESLRRIEGFDFGKVLDFFVNRRESLLRLYPWPKEADARSRAHPLAAVAAVTVARQRQAEPAEGKASSMVGQLWAALALAPALRNKYVTSVMAPNDKYAQGRHLRWLKEIGLAPPQGLSLLSFDNKYQYSFYPVSTVDPGFERLGYRTFHLFLREAALGGGTRKDIAAEPWVVDRGSVANINRERDVTA